MHKEISQSRQLGEGRTSNCERGFLHAGTPHPPAPENESRAKIHLHLVVKTPLYPSLPRSAVPLASRRPHFTTVRLRVKTTRRQSPTPGWRPGSSLSPLPHNLFVLYGLVCSLIECCRHSGMERGPPFKFAGMRRSPALDKSRRSGRVSAVSARERYKPVNSRLKCCCNVESAVESPGKIPSPLPALKLAMGANQKREEIAVDLWFLFYLVRDFALWRVTPADECLDSTLVRGSGWRGQGRLALRSQRPAQCLPQSPPRVHPSLATLAGDGPLFVERILHTTTLCVWDGKRRGCHGECASFVKSSRCRVQVNETQITF